MIDIVRALGRAVVSQLHPRMLWLAVWPFLAALLAWALIGIVVRRPVLDWMESVLDGSMLGSGIDRFLGSLGVAGGLSVVVWLLYLACLFALTVLTALLILGTVAMPAVVAHVSSRDYPNLAKKRGGTFAGSVGNALWVGVVFVVGFAVTIPFWLIAPLALLLPLFWWGWAASRMFRYDALVEHASADERALLFRQHRWSFFAIGVVVGLLNYVPPLFFVVPVLGGLAFTHYALDALRRLRAERGEVGRPADPAWRAA